MVRNRKSKGINAERELVHLFWKENWAAVRVAGSGASRYPTPDVLASNGERPLAIECKSCATNNQYLTKEEITELKQFSDMFGAEAWVGVRFSSEAWRFYKIGELRETEKNYVVNRKEMGLDFQTLIT